MIPSKNREHIDIYFFNKKPLIAFVVPPRKKNLCGSFLCHSFSIYFLVKELLNMTGIQRRHKEAWWFGSIYVWGKLLNVPYKYIIDTCFISIVFRVKYVFRPYKYNEFWFLSLKNKIECFHPHYFFFCFWSLMTNLCSYGCQDYNTFMIKKYPCYVRLLCSTFIYSYYV